MQEVSSRAYDAAISEAVQRTVERMTRDKITQSVLEAAQRFVKSVILPFLVMLLGKRGVSQHTASMSCQLACSVPGAAPGLLCS